MMRAEWSANGILWPDHVRQDDIMLKIIEVSVQMRLYAQGGHPFGLAHEASDCGMASVGGDVAGDDRNDSGLNLRLSARSKLIQ
jgi:hypothetical protein